MEIDWKRGFFFFFFFSIDRRGVVDEWKVMSTAGMDEKFKGRRSCKYCCWQIGLCVKFCAWNGTV